ncbi:hypothetical protein CRYUN_Cryun09bG0183000 [Craigia yunnanensis]
MFSRVFVQFDAILPYFASQLEGIAGELAENVAQFVSSLPKTVRQVEEEPITEHVQKMFDEANDTDNHHHHHHAHAHGHVAHGHDHAHAAGFMDAYGLGHTWVS